MDPDFDRKPKKRNPLETREHLAAELRRIIRNEELDPRDRISALDKLATLKGLKIKSEEKDWRRLPQPALEEHLLNVVIPALEAHRRVRIK